MSILSIYTVFFFIAVGGVFDALDGAGGKIFHRPRADDEIQAIRLFHWEFAAALEGASIGRV
jgi:hypothetical protein